MRQVFDRTEAGFDILFFDNNLLAHLRWESEQAIPETCAELCLDTMAHAAELWLPERYSVTLADVHYDGPGADNESMRIDTQAPQPMQSGAAAAAAARADIDHTLRERSAFGAGVPWMLRSLETAVKGWNRIAVPAGARVEGEWHAIDPDGMARTCEWRAAPPLHGQRTIWLRLSDAMAATHASLQVFSLGEAELRMMTGPSVFRPVSDPRPADTYNVRGVPLGAWHAANIALYDGVIRGLHELGWQSAT